MGQGLQVWDASGNLVLDIGDRLTRFVDVIAVAVGASGTVQLPPGTPWWYSVVTSGTTAVGSAYTPAISVDANNLLSYGPNTVYGTGQVPCTLVVGVY